LKSNIKSNNYANRQSRKPAPYSSTKTAIDNAITVIESTFLTVAPNLSAEERLKFGSVNETNKLFVNKVREYYQTEPSLASPDVDWVEYEADFQDRAFAATREKRINIILRLITDFKIAHDFDNYQAGLDDYKYSQYKESTKTAGYSEKVNDLKQFFQILVAVVLHHKANMVLKYVKKPFFE